MNFNPIPNPNRTEIKSPYIPHPQFQSPQFNQTQTQTLIQFSPIQSNMAFQCGDLIEVSSKEEGYVGSYYAAHIIGRFNPHRTKFRNYVVEYKTLVTDDHSGPLQEMVSVDEVRPVPPEVCDKGFRVSDVVDAYDNDGWWVGVVTKIIAGCCVVYFDLTDEEIVYSFDRIRVHHDWINGKWIPSNSKFMMNRLYDSD